VIEPAISLSDVDDDDTDGIVCSTPSVSPVPSTSSSQLPWPSKKGAKKTAIDNLANKLAQSSEQTRKLQHTIVGAVNAGATDSTPRSYGNFLASAVQNIHPTLLARFYSESMEMVVRYHNETDRIKSMSQQVPVATGPARMSSIQVYISKY